MAKDNEKIKVLINTPHLKLLGGVSNHYLGLKDYWTEDVKYNIVGKRGMREGGGIYWLPWDNLKFIIKILIFRPDIILLNPSLAKFAVARDFIFLKIAKIFKKKVVVFFHGFNTNNIPHLNIRYITNNLNKCECVFVLASEFARIIKSWGVISPIHLVTTKVDDKLTIDFNIEIRTGKINTILFLTRITEEKGIFIALKAFHILCKEYHALQMKVVGDGSALERAKRMCSEEKIENVVFFGALHGKQLIKEYENSDLYIFPSYHEGMPTSVLEAMAFGLPVITRNVGGLADFFKNGEMGFITNSFDSHDFAKMISQLLGDEELTKSIAIGNYKYAKNNFMASNVAKKIEEIIRRL